MGNTNIKDYVKYIIFAGIIYAVLKVVPTKQLTNFEISSLVCVILVGIFSLECLTTNNSENMNDLGEKPQTPNVFDFDFDIVTDVDVDFKKSKKKILVDEELTEEEIKKESVNSKAKELGIDMQAVEDELYKRQLGQAIENDELTEQELKDKIKELKEKHNRKVENPVKKKLQTYSDKTSMNCEIEVSKMRREMQDTISILKQEMSHQRIKSEQSSFAKKYMSILIADLLESRIIDSDDVENINAKLISGTIPTNDTIKSLEKLKSIGRPKKVSNPKDRQNDMKYSDLPADYYKPLGDNIANNWDNEYTILNTDKWQIPQSRPPVCVSNGPCKVCPTQTDGYGVNLKEWDDSRVVSNQKISKKWAKDQAKS